MNMNNISKINEHEQNLKKSCKQIQIAQMSFICHIHNYTEYNEERNVQLGVQCLAQGSHLSRGQFLPEPGFETTTSGYKSNALSIRH